MYIYICMCGGFYLNSILADQRPEQGWAHAAVSLVRYLVKKQVHGHYAEDDGDELIT